MADVSAEKKPHNLHEDSQTEDAKERQYITMYYVPYYVPHYALVSDQI